MDTTVAPPDDDLVAETEAPVRPSGDGATPGVPDSSVPDGAGAPPARRRPRWLDRIAGATPQQWITAGIVAFCVGFTFHQLNPEGLVFTENVPTGGDMGAHVWGPAFLRDHLIPNLRLTGWTMDWYAGFPAYQFYFLVPALAVVLLNVGLDPLPATLFLLAAAGAVLFAYRDPRLAGIRRYVLAAAIVVAVLVVGLPYGVAFKLVAISGVVSLPVSAWALGKLSGLPFPGPALVSLFSLFFVFDRSFNIYGGNAASTMAGEFSFAISLSLALLYLGFLIRGLETGEGRGWAALLLALTGLCHVIPAFYAVAATAVVLVVHLSPRRVWWVASTSATAGLVAAFWVLPFVGRVDYMNNMGWEKIERYTDYLLTRERLNPDFLKDYPAIELVILLAGVGLVASLVMRRRIGVLLALWAVGSALAFVFLPEGRMWNARVLPFYYLSLYLLAGVGVAEVARLLAWALRGLGPVQDPDRARRWALNGLAVAGLIGVWLAVGLPMGAVPGTGVGADGRREWLGLDIERSFVPGWAEWNFSGIEGKTAPDAYPEFYDLVQTMETVGAEQGCGRAMWEFAPELNRYGSTMVPMLLPHFTDGCIGSMEGLYFEASPTVPYHFLVQSELSGPAVDPDGDGNFEGGPSRPMRGLPYGDFDIDLGVEHLQMLGVRYYLAFSDTAVTAAAEHPDLTEIARSGPWHVYEVAESPVVTPLAVEPVVITGVSPHQSEWLDVAVPWFLDRDAWAVPLAAGGPSSWQRVEVDDQGAPAPFETRPLEPVNVSDIRIDQDRVSFRVDRVGEPVLVRVSYFPNWTASGAEGPWRVTPNLMLVVPTDNEVSLHYGWTPLDVSAYLLSGVGLVALVLLFRRPRFRLDRAWIDLMGGLDWLAGALGRAWRGRPDVGEGDGTADGGGPPPDTEPTQVAADATDGTSLRPTPDGADGGVAPVDAAVWDSLPRPGHAPPGSTSGA